MSMAAFKKEISEYKNTVRALNSGHLSKNIDTHPIIFKWRNSDKNVAYYEKLLSDVYAEEETKLNSLLRFFARNDLFFLLWHILNRNDLLHPWLIERCWEVQNNPNENLDLWAREHYKSTIITFALSIQDILSSHGINPHPKWKGREVTVGIFSCTRPIAKAFLAQIKREFESNELLLTLFPDVLYANPGKDAPKWSEDTGLVVKRKSNPKESTVEAWGVVEGQPTSKHFLICVYDDLVTRDHVSSPYMIKKVLGSWEVSTNLGTEGGYRRYIGTRYHLNDPYATMLKRKAVTLRLHQPTSDGSLTDNPVLKSKQELEDKLRAMGTYTYGCQMMQDPLVDEASGFKLEWLQYWDKVDHKDFNIYLICDPANTKKEYSDYTSMFVIALGHDQNYYILDIVRDRLNLRERAELYIELHKKYKPNKAGYEEYGMQADIFYIKELQEELNYRFEIDALGGHMNKYDRIRRAVPAFESHKVYLPRKLFRKDYQGNTVDLVSEFINEEFYSFPVSAHDDMLDCFSRIFDKVKPKGARNIEPVSWAIFPSEEEDFDASYFMNKAEGL